MNTWPEKSRTRRAEIRKNRPDTDWIDWRKFKEKGVPVSLCIAFGFFVLASSILMLRQDVVPYRAGQWIHHDIVSRVKFTYNDPLRMEDKRREAINRVPRVYTKIPPTNDKDVWGVVEDELLCLPALVVADHLPPKLASFDAGTITALRLAAQNADVYTNLIHRWMEDLRECHVEGGGRQWPLIILSADQHRQELDNRRPIRLNGEGDIDPRYTYAAGSPILLAKLTSLAPSPSVTFSQTLKTSLANYALTRLQPNYQYDEAATAGLRDEVKVPPSEGRVEYGPDQVLVFKSNRPLDQAGWKLLHAEHHAYIASLDHAVWKARIGVAGVVFCITCILCLYIGYYQPRVVQNHARGIAIAALLLSMLLLNQIAAIGNVPLYLFGTAPTLLVAMIIAIGYDQRTAIGIAGLHGLLATVALDQSVTFFIVIWVGVMTACFILDDIRTRSKLIEVGGATAFAMAAVTGAAGLIAFERFDYIVQNCLYAGASGLVVGFIVLGILPFVEKAFKITTSMTLLELADQSQPLLRRLQQEAQGTYNHSLQVGVIAEAAAESIGANALLCRVASYYHDVGKINKPEYFVENQTGGESRHLNLTANVSRIIIVGHVKDGVELAKEYNLPASIIAFIQQHHGTTLVEYFYRQACTQQGLTDPDGPEVQDHDYRYEGPKPKTREIAIVMLADCVESASRCLDEPTASRVETLVHTLAMKRLTDGQFDDCDLTMRDLERIERTMIKTVLAIYHGRIAYEPEPAPSAAPAAVESESPAANVGSA
jgi:hypothetical protein